MHIFDFQKKNVELYLYSLIINQSILMQKRIIAKGQESHIFFSVFLTPPNINYGNIVRENNKETLHKNIKIS